MPTLTSQCWQICIIYIYIYYIYMHSSSAYTIYMHGTMSNHWSCFFSLYGVFGYGSSHPASPSAARRDPLIRLTEGHVLQLSLTETLNRWRLGPSKLQSNMDSAWLCGQICPNRGVGPLGRTKCLLVDGSRHSMGLPYVPVDSILGPMGYRTWHEFISLLCQRTTEWM